GPITNGLLELAGLDVLLEQAYAGPKEKVPSKASLIVKRRTASTSQGHKDQVELDQVADRIAGRGVSSLFPDASFIVIGHRAPSEGVLQVGNIMREIQNKILACDQNYRKALKTTLNSIKETASYDDALRIMESSFPRCP
ncbi:MAG: hypothetical protein IH919_01625, partial [Deltaproteobacteria bacterium]|nr:hypothetical protein [Deltaproteobacteria bacterium]